MCFGFYCPCILVVGATSINAFQTIITRLLLSFHPKKKNVKLPKDNLKLGSGTLCFLIRYQRLVILGKMFRFTKSNKDGDLSNLA